jgi:diguanylate cyclase (GGDEF)-like protein/PAS domain S-box-containing protein
MLHNKKDNILIVDDEARMRDSIKALLDANGYNINTAINGHDAISKLKQSHYDVILLDLVMPESGGFEVMDFVREYEIDSSVIVISGNNTIDSAIGALRKGAFDFLTKPYHREQLVKCIENAISQKRLHEENKRFHARLKESERMHRFMVENSPDIIYVLDQQSKFIYVNQAVESLLGFDRTEIIGKHYSEIIHPEDMEVAQYTFNERRTGNRATKNVEIRLRKKIPDGENKYFDNLMCNIELNSMGIYTADAERKDKSFMGTYGVARDVTDRKRAEAMVEYQAYHDLLTGLPNRVLFSDRVSTSITHARRNNKMLAVMFIDLDQFKYVNDTQGHIIGDELLRVVAKRIKSVLRETDTVARIGGDEFLVLLPVIVNQTDAEKVANKILEEIRKPIAISNNEFNITASIGVSIYPEHGRSLEALAKNADIAMYSVKGKGKDNYHFFTNGMNVAISERISLVNDLRKSISNNELTVFYQPQIQIENKSIYGLEALTRWMHPDKGMLTPTEFMGFAEEDGIITDLGMWLIRAVCHDIRNWQQAGLHCPRIAINMSASQFEHPDIVPMFTEVLKEYGISGDFFEIEITETALLSDINMAINKCRQLAAAGVRFTIDDFGTGYSSLNYLHRLPVDALKIDRSFLTNLSQEQQDCAIIPAILAIAEKMGLDVISEGVESEWQYRYLRSLGCSVMQGFYFSKPVPNNTVSQILKGEEFSKIAH